MKCSNGHENDGTAQFCTVCGIALSLPATTSYAPPPPAPAYLPPPVGYGVPRPSGTGFGVTALVLGIVGLVGCWLGLILGPLAIIFGALGIRRFNEGAATSKGMAVAGLVLGIITVILYGILLIAAAANS